MSQACQLGSIKTTPAYAGARYFMPRRMPVLPVGEVWFCKGKLFNAQHGNKVAQAIPYTCKCCHNLGVKLAARAVGYFAAGFIKCL